MEESCYFIVIFGILVVGVDVLGGQGGGERGKEGGKKKKNNLRGDSCEAPDETDVLKRSECVFVCMCVLVMCVMC